MPTANQGSSETPVRAFPSLTRLTARAAFLCTTNQGQKIKYKLNINNGQTGGCAPKADSPCVCLSVSSTAASGRSIAALSQVEKGRVTCRFLPHACWEFESPARARHRVPSASLGVSGLSPNACWKFPEAPQHSRNKGLLCLPAGASFWHLLLLAGTPCSASPTEFKPLTCCSVGGVRIKQVSKIRWVHSSRMGKHRISSLRLP